MNCLNCKKKMARDWVYCPYCGQEIEKKGLFENFDDIFKGVFKSFSKIFSGDSGNKFTIRMSTPGTKTITKKPILKMPKEIIEPKVTKKHIGDELEIKVELPGVKSLKNIRLTRIGESIELKAVEQKKGYFKIISVPEDLRVIKKSLDNEVLMVRMK